MELTRLRPTDVKQLLNSFPEFGTVLTGTKLTALRNNAGLRIGDGKTVDLYKLLGFLVRQRFDGPTVAQVDESKADAHRRRVRERQQRMIRADQEIYIPDCGDEALRAEVSGSLKRFCEVILPERFYKAWSQPHLLALSKAETAIRRGGLFSLAMPRGSGKTALTDAACLWAIVTGHRRFVMIVGATEKSAQQRFDSLKMSLTKNETLRKLFPEVCHPFYATDGQKLKKVRINGELLHLEMSVEQIIIPVIEGSQAAGSVIMCRGITGDIRGANSTLPDGSMIRPDLVLIDDPQTAKSAKSPIQCRDRETIISGDILGLAGGDVELSGLMTCTVIREGDLADTFLDQDRHPAWQGQRTAMLTSEPTDSGLWERYAEIRADGLRNGDNGAAATAFYRTHREQMDAGAEASWPENFRPGEISAIQSAMNLKFRDEAAFYAEYQNAPISRDADAHSLLSVPEITEKQHGAPRFVIPMNATHLTASIDVQENCLYYAVAAWGSAFSGYVIDYGTWPDQNASMFHYTSIRRTLRKSYPGTGLEGSLRMGLDDLSDSLMLRSYPTEGGAQLNIERLLVDTGWKSDIVKTFARERRDSRITCAFGRYFGAAATPITEQPKKSGDRIGESWRLRTDPNAKIRQVTFDTNYWKSFLHSRIATAYMDRGSVTFYQARPTLHQMIAEHLRAESRVRVEARGRTAYEWKLLPGAPDNHFFDCLVGCCVGASMQGVQLTESRTIAPPVRRKKRRGSIKPL